MPVEVLRADGFGLFVAIAIGIAFVNLVRKAQQAAEQQRRRLEEAERVRRRGGVTRPASRPATRRAASRSGLLEDLQRNLEVLTGMPATTVPARQKPAGRDREVLDLDLEAEDVAQRRIEEAEARNRALSDADHAAFEARIRKTPAQPVVPVATRAPLPDLHRAIIWNELLGPPVALRDRNGPPGLRP